MNCRLLYLVGQLRAGGQERQLCNLFLAMDRERYRPALAVWNFSKEDLYVPEIRRLAVPLYFFPRTLSAAAKLRAFRRLVRQLEPEVVHSYSFYTNIAAYWGTRGTRALAIGSVRGDFDLDREGCGPWLGSISAFLPRSQIFNSFIAAENAQRSKSLFVPGQIFVVRNGLDLQGFRMAPLSNARPVRILANGSLMPYKRWDRLLAAARALNLCGSNFLVQIVGDGPLRGLLEQHARELGVADHVEFIRHSDNIPCLLADSTFLVHTADSEGCPNAVMEAMACGRAVVATDAGDVPYLVEDGKTGFVVRRGDDAALVERIATLIANWDLCRRMGEAARAKAEQEFGLNRLVSETLAAYQAAGWRG